MAETDLRQLPRVEVTGVRGGTGERPELRWLALDRLVVDDAFQRRADGRRSLARIAKIAREFDWRSFGALVVAELADGRFAILDGQHRAAAALARGDIREVPCVVLLGDQATQAQAFQRINRDRAGLDKAQMFHAALAAGDPDALSIKEVLDVVGIQVQRNPHPDGVKPLHTRAIAALGELLRSPGRAHLLDALEMIAEAWPDQPNQFGTAQIKAVTLVVKALADAADDDTERDRFQKRLRRVIGQTDLEGLRDRATAFRNQFGGGSTFRHMAQLLLGDFNKGLKTKIGTRFTT